MSLKIEIKKIYIIKKTKKTQAESAQTQAESAQTQAKSAKIFIFNIFDQNLI